MTRFIYPVSIFCHLLLGLKCLSSIILPHYLWRSLGTFSLLMCTENTITQQHKFLMVRLFCITVIFYIIVTNTGVLAGIYVNLLIFCARNRLSVSEMCSLNTIM